MEITWMAEYFIIGAYDIKADIEAEAQEEAESAPLTEKVEVLAPQRKLAGDLAVLEAGLERDVQKAEEKLAGIDARLKGIVSGWVAIDLKAELKDERTYVQRDLDEARLRLERFKEDVIEDPPI